ncbi:MAG: helix-turn-helix transcriptional regulator [Thermoleophilaceae bacterium]
MAKESAAVGAELQAPDWLRPLESTCAAAAALLHPHAEVVAHDIDHDVIVAIWNGFSGRSVGDPSLLDELPEPVEGSLVLGPYAKVLPDGRQLTSVSAVILGDEEPVGFICVNLDRSPLDGVIELLGRFAAPVTSRPAGLFARDWREQIALVVDEECRSRGLDRDRFTRAERLELVRRLDEEGLFATRHAAEHAARSLGVSRASVYALLREVRG